MEQTLTCSCGETFQPLKFYRGKNPKCFECFSPRKPTTEVILNKDQGSFRFSKGFVKHLERQGYINLSDIEYGYFPRHHPGIVGEFKAYGPKKASGSWSKLEIVVASQGMYYVADYKGYESLVQPSNMVKF